MNKIDYISSISLEIEGLWNSYMGDCLEVCVLKFFVNRVEDSEIRAILQYRLDLSIHHINELTSFFNKLQLPIPQGFSDRDVDINAPRLFTDEFYLMYLANMARVEMISYNQILRNCEQHDIIDYFTRLIAESSDFYNKVVEVKAPKVKVIRNIEYIKQYIQDKDFLADWFGKKRSLLAGEITHISLVILANIVGKTLTTGFCQVSKTKEIAEYMFRGSQISARKIDVFTSILTSENIPIPSNDCSLVTDSTIAPFSKKLMMFHITSLGSVSVSNDGMALAESLRSDLHTTYLEIATEAMIYSKDGADILINNGWFEDSPQATKNEKYSAKFVNNNQEIER